MLTRFEAYNKVFPKEYRFGVPIDEYYLPRWGKVKEGDVWERFTKDCKKMDRLTNIVWEKGMAFSLHTNVSFYKKKPFDTYRFDRDSYYFPTFLRFMYAQVTEGKKKVKCKCCGKKAKPARFVKLQKNICRKCFVGVNFYPYYRANYYEHLTRCTVNKYGRYTVAPLYGTLIAQPIQLAIFNEDPAYRLALSRSIIDFVRGVSGFCEFKSIYPFYENKDIDLPESKVIEILQPILIDHIRDFIKHYYEKRYVNKATLNIVRLIKNYGWEQEFDKFLIDVDDFIRFGDTYFFDSCEGLDRYSREFDIELYEIVIGIRKKKGLRTNHIRQIWEKLSKNASKIPKQDHLITIGEGYGL